MEEIRLWIRGLPQTATIHIVGSTIGWDLGLEYRSPDEAGETVLIFDPNNIGVEFKHFVLCEFKDRDRVHAAISTSGYQVTGIGDAYGPLRRVWFLLPDYPTFGEGVYTNNTFTE